jgi:hypothetical protein
MLYDFKNPAVTKSKQSAEKLSDFLDRNGYPSVSPTGFEVIRRDLSTEESAGNIEYRKDGVYLISNGQEYKGYIYLKFKVHIERYGYPKFHILKCQTLIEAAETSSFMGRYYWHNSNTVEIEDRPSGIIHENITLNLCGFCRNYNSPGTTQEFYDELKEDFKDVQPNQSVEVDLFGYVREWQQISQKYKEKKNYTCENCGISMEGADRRYIHTDHKNGDKTRNIESNFVCLCILCHCYKDELHRENFGKRRMKRELITFVEKFRGRLVNNIHLSQYDADNNNLQ